MYIINIPRVVYIYMRYLLIKLYEYMRLFSVTILDIFHFLILSIKVSVLSLDAGCSIDEV